MAVEMILDGETRVRIVRKAKQRGYVYVMDVLTWTTSKVHKSRLTEPGGSRR